MTIQIGAFEFNRLTAQPFGYDESEVTLGRTARKWLITGLATPAEWLDLLTEYDTWRTARIENESPQSSGTVGTTIAFSGDGPGGQTWTNVACWFLAAPTGEQSGSFISISCELIDATQSLEVILKDIETTAEEEDAPDLGTYSVGGATLTLTKPPDGFTDGPQLDLTASGVHYISGPKTATAVKRIEGTTDSGGWGSILVWYAGIVGSTPGIGNYYPIEPPSATADVRIVDGIKTTVYTVSLTLAQVK